MKAAIEEERDKFKLPRSILPNRVCVCVCLSAWCVSDLLVVRVCMCVCTFNSMLLYNFFFPLQWRICHTLVVSERVGNLNAGIQIFFL